MLKIEKIRVSYNGQSALSIDQLCIEPGEKVCLIGKSGSGKTTLIECISGLRIYEGFISADVKDVSYSPQKHDLIPNFSVKTNVLMGRFGGRSFVKNIYNLMKKEPQIDSILGSFNIVGNKDQFVRTLSGGEAQRALLARAMYENKSIILLDEPTSALDILNSRNAMRVLLSYKTKSTIICAIHNLALLDFFQRVIILKEGKIILDEKVTNVDSEKVSGYFDDSK